jgi:hypothetical protein
MIKYNLTCQCKKTFESWFASSAEYDALKRKGFISCIYCESKNVNKSIMAPNLSSKSNKSLEKTKVQKNITKKLSNFRKYIEKNCENVGDNFLKEAKNIYYDNKKSKGIYGKATPEETAELLDEGIEVITIPWINKKEN